MRVADDDIDVGVLDELKSAVGCSHLSHDEDRVIGSEPLMCIGGQVASDPEYEDGLHE